MNDDDWKLSSTYGVSNHSIQIDPTMLWGNDMQDVRDYLSKQVAIDMDRDIIEKLKAMIDRPKQKTKEEKVLDIVNGGFQDHFGISIQEFQAIYEEILETNPEKLV
ncbi:MAG: hypothetical protein DRH57_08265 [Candidatus Cloacimonadota bacterium]|nr:MAG: hypothetical protein DRH57_08265 [Candidatus Cloacimonadota bacterium]